MPGRIVYAGFPSVVVYDKPEGGDSDRRKPVQHLLWGDEMEVTGSATGDWLPVYSRRVNGWVEQRRTQAERLLDIIFVDIGQGDGCLVSTPQDKYILVDAGEGDNMVRFLRWRFDQFAEPRTFEAAIISHPDSDHYHGFAPIFDEQQVNFETIYHNGIVERSADRASESLGRTARKGSVRYLLDVMHDRSTLEQLLSQSALIANKRYPTMLKKALDSGRVGDIAMLSTADGYMPGYGPDDPLTIQVLAPVAEPDSEGNLRLRWFDENPGRTKNGNSIVLRILYKNVRILLGGDLNGSAENHLLGHYTCYECPPATVAHEEMIVESARSRFECEVAKCCHHGSADFTDTFMRAVNPAITVISSGDDEPHAHPRADTLGAIGRHGRGRRPLIFSTELARSAKEMIKHPYVLQQKLAKLDKAVERAASEEAKEKARARRDKFYRETVLRSVAVYGAINLRTDGNDLVMAQKIEKPRDKAHKWDLYVFKRSEGGVLEYRPEIA